MAAAYRSEQRRLLSFIRMSDFMMCDTLHTVLVESVREVLESVRPALTVGLLAAGANGSSGKSRPGSAAPAARSLQTMHTLLNGSRRQRQSAALAGMQLAPVTVAQQQAAAAAGEAGIALQRAPVFELQVLLTQSLEELAFEPEPEHFQVGALHSWACHSVVLLLCINGLLEVA